MSKDLNSPSKLSWVKLRRDDINDFKRFYTKLFSGNKKYLPVEEILADLDIKYLVMTIKAGDEIIGFATL